MSSDVVIQMGYLKSLQEASKSNPFEENNRDKL
jgi:hypothetical protein